MAPQGALNPGILAILDAYLEHRGEKVKNVHDSASSFHPQTTPNLEEIVQEGTYDSCRYSNSMIYRLTVFW